LPGKIEVIPGIPNPNSQKIYHVQVGAFTAPEVAVRAEQLVKSAGFTTARDQNGSLYRVFAMNIPAANVYPAIQRLISLGFSQFWVRER
jgi:hypothetical protein